MLQFHDGNWEHRAFWGEDLMTWGIAGQPSRQAMGPLPETGKWVRLEVEAQKVGLGAETPLDGWAFAQYDGTCYWDAAGITRRPFDSPWQDLAAAYHRLGDQKTLDTLLKRHPSAAVGIGDIHAADGDWKRSMNAYRKALSGQPADTALLTKLAAVCKAAGRTREAVPYLASLSAANPNDTSLSLEVAALQAWFGQEKELADTCSRGLEWAKDTAVPETADRVAKACCLLLRAEKAQREAALTLARKAVRLGKNSPSLPWFQIDLGMAEYRSGHFAEANAALIAAAKDAYTAHMAGTAAFYRAMSRFQQGKKDEARKLAAEAAAKMEPRPKDEMNPLPGDARAEHLTADAGSGAKRPAAADALRSWRDQRKQGGDGGPSVATALERFGLHQLGEHNYADAEALLRDCLSIREAKQPADWTTFNTQALLGAALLGQKKYADAEPLLLSGYKGLKQYQARIPATSKNRLSEALERLVQLYEAIGKKEEADKWREERAPAKKKTHW
jgi:tetratricopeptide (TPR) repeat protein